MDRQRDIGNLLTQAKSGDNMAFQKLYDLVCNYNLYIIRNLVKNEQDAEDILQDTCIKIYERLDQVQNTKLYSFLSWSGRIASNTALDFLRKKKPMLFSEIEQEGESDFIPFEIEDIQPERQPELVLDQKETSEIVQELLKQLSDEQRICVMMFYLQDMSIREIAESIQCSENTVKSRLNYARKKIQAQEEFLEKKGISLRGLAPLFLLGYLLRQEMASAAEAGSMLAQNPLLWQKLFSGEAWSAGRTDQTGGIPNAETERSPVSAGTPAAIGSRRLAALLLTGGLVIGGLLGSYLWIQSKQTHLPASSHGRTPSVSVSPQTMSSAPEVENTSDTDAAGATAAASETVQPTEAASAVEVTPAVESGPTAEPTSKPTRKPKAKPTRKPTSKLKAKPTRKPTSKPKPTKRQEDDLNLEEDTGGLDDGWE